MKTCRRSFIATVCGLLMAFAGLARPAKAAPIVEDLQPDRLSFGPDFETTIEGRSVTMRECTGTDVDPAEVMCAIRMMHSLEWSVYKISKEWDVKRRLFRYIKVEFYKLLEVRQAHPGDVDFKPSGMNEEAAMHFFLRDRIPTNQL